jgi:uncharacterized protein YecE (DUF72 family)
MKTIYIGTSGYSYREWVGVFYPPGIKGPEMLGYYAARFNAVEINNTFYQLPAPETLNAWKERVGPGFRFAVKAGRMITHGDDFGIPGGYLELFLSRVAGLGERLGPVLFQFPAAQGDPERLAEFFEYLKRRPVREGLAFTPVIELRNRKLLNRGFIDALHGYQLDLCLNDGYLAPEEWPEPRETAYLRLRNGPYDRDALRRIAVRVREWAGRGKDGYLFFKHETTAPKLAATMAEVLFYGNF